MTSRRRLAPLIAAVLLVSVMLASAVPTSYDPPAFVSNPVDHVDTLIGTGTGARG